MPAPEQRSDSGHVRTVLSELERMQDQAQVGQVLPDLGNVVALERSVEDQAGEDIGDLVREHAGSMQLLAGVQPGLQVGPDCALPLVCHHHGDDEAGVDYDAHRSGSRAARASATRAMDSPEAPF